MIAWIKARLMLVAVIAAFLAGAVPAWWLTARFKDADIAALKAAQAEAAAAQALAVVERANEAAVEKTKGDSAAAQKTVAAENRQTAERIRYVQVPVPVASDCRLPDDAFRMLVDAVRNANAGSAATTSPD